MHTWQLQKARACLTQLIKEAQFEPQVISRHGRKEAVVISIEKYQELLGEHKEDFLSFMQKSPLYGLELHLGRAIERIL